MRTLVNLSKNFYRDKTILVTGHTGFKGSWLTVALNLLGARVVGLSRGVTSTSLISATEDFKSSVTSFTGSVSDLSALKNIIKSEKPEIIFHLAAQPLVLKGYKDPLNTIYDNVVGTLNVCEIFREDETLKSVISITTDKVYKNQEQIWSYREIDPLGGFDPYSSSKSAADLIAQSYYKSFISKETNRQMFVMRGGNVIGAGDISENRLVPDFFRALQKKTPLTIRNPSSVRPWQHVIDLIHAYLLVGQSKNINGVCCYNIGPDLSSNLTVAEVLQKLQRAVGSDLAIDYQPVNKRETGLLSLDSTQFRRDFGWKPLIDIDTAIELTCEWAGIKNPNYYNIAKNQLRKKLFND